ncbi:hypothetical protein L2E82_06745 [Cichorium intybus]|uniref:Uncharacterized protein n=1 Tax=Cichorium intybus TaxID=13427 RepID=A0ACB9HAQ2_CICIN|nr:hypothetical protein L2E82_06745 [Cichorium intybus]
MVSGKVSSRPETQPPENIDDLEENEEDRPSNSAAGSQRNVEKDATRPLLEEVTIVGLGTSKNTRGAKIWFCNHCNVQYTSSYTRIHTYFLGLKTGRRPKYEDVWL